MTMNNRITRLFITEYSYSYTEVKPDGTVTDLYNKGENIQPKQMVIEDGN